MSVPTTRELNVRTIFVVTIVSVFLLVAIVYAARAGYEYFAQRQLDRAWAVGAERVHADYGVRMDNADLAKLETEQRALLTEATDGRVTITDAMQQIADRY